MKQLNIGILGTRGIPNHYGGFEQFAQYLAAGLVQKGHRVAVYCSHTHPYKEHEWNGVQLIHCHDPEERYGTAGQFLYDRNCNRDSHDRNFDIVLHLGYTSDAIWHKKWAAGAVHIVNMDGLEWKRSKYNRLVRRFLKWSEGIAARHADVLVADSTAIQDHLQKTYGVNAAYIPYGAVPFSNPSPEAIRPYGIKPGHYHLVIARMEPENNIEMIIRGHLAVQDSLPLVIIGNTQNRHGQFLRRKYMHPRVIFAGPQYDQTIVNNLRYYCAQYFHGHSAGGTNPSLLEAMACGCPIAAHQNIFNQAVLQQEADYFSSAEEVAQIIRLKKDPALLAAWKETNLQRIHTLYTEQKIIDSYGQLMLDAVAPGT